ncbi:hypothetical protein ACS0TY_001225 [Phlomoides rotata]
MNAVKALLGEYLCMWCDLQGIPIGRLDRLSMFDILYRLHDQVIIGTLIIQDSTVGLLLAMLPVLGGTSGVMQGTNELNQLASDAFCLLVAWCSDKVGLSLELGLCAAGVMTASQQ